MCRLVAELAGADKQVVRETFARLELQSGNPGIDLRLTSEIYGRIHMKMRELGLDPSDTTPHELYQALINLAAKHDGFLATRLGVEDPSDFAEIAEAIVRLVSRMRLPKHIWGLKPTAAKNLLKKSPPKVLMKALHYRSLDSMLKRESPALLVALARHCEPVHWQRHFTNTYKRLAASDFEVRDIEVQFLGGKHWQALGKSKIFDNHHSSIIHNPETGVIVLLPLKTTETPSLKGLTLTSLLLTLHYINDIRAFSSYGKFIHMRPDFGQLLADRVAEKQHELFVAGQNIHWRVVHRYFGSRNRSEHPEIFEPHVQPEDLAYRKAEAILFRLEPALHFWHDLDYVGLPQPDGPISFNLADVALSLVNSRPYEKRLTHHLRDAVWNEVYCRYVGERNFERQLLLQLDEHSVGQNTPIEEMEFAW